MQIMHYLIPSQYQDSEYVKNIENIEATITEYMFENQTTIQGYLFGANSINLDNFSIERIEQVDDQNVITILIPKDFYERREAEKRQEEERLKEERKKALELLKQRKLKEELLRKKAEAEKKQKIEQSLKAIAEELHKALEKSKIWDAIGISINPDEKDIANNVKKNFKKNLNNLYINFFEDENGRHSTYNEMSELNQNGLLRDIRYFTSQDGKKAQILFFRDYKNLSHSKINSNEYTTDIRKRGFGKFEKRTIDDITFTECRIYVNIEILKRRLEGANTPERVIEKFVEFLKTRIQQEITEYEEAENTKPEDKIQDKENIAKEILKRWRNTKREKSFEEISREEVSENRAWFIDEIKRKNTENFKKIISELFLQEKEKVARKLIHLEKIPEISISFEDELQQSGMPGIIIEFNLQIPKLENKEFKFLLPEILFNAYTKKSYRPTEKLTVKSIGHRHPYEDDNRDIYLTEITTELFLLMEQEAHEKITKLLARFLTRIDENNILILKNKKN